MRRVFMAAVLGWSGIAAQAQTETHPLSPAQSLSCLKKSGSPPIFSARSRTDLRQGGLRVLLKFKQPDEPPEVETLFNTADEDMQDSAHRYLRSYRLPCLTPQDGVVTAVQEFAFSSTDRDASPLPAPPASGGPEFCVVMPREAPPQFTGDYGSRKPQHIVVTGTFNGSGDQVPKVEFAYSSGSSKLETYVKNRVAEYRMPCRRAGDKPQHFQQTFSFVIGDVYRFKREAFSLREFLMLTRDPRNLKAHYDLSTMGCPFKVQYTLFGGKLRNEAWVTGPADPNRLPFLDWLASLELNLTEDQREDLFGSRLQINVGCGTVNLDGEG